MYSSLSIERKRTIISCYMTNDKMIQHSMPRKKKNQPGISSNSQIIFPTLLPRLLWSYEVPGQNTFSQNVSLSCSDLNAHIGTCPLNYFLHFWCLGKCQFTLYRTIAFGAVTKSCGPVYFRSCIAWKRHSFAYKLSQQNDPIACYSEHLLHQQSYNTPRTTPRQTNFLRTDKLTFNWKFQNIFSTLTLIRTFSCSLTWL